MSRSRYVRPLQPKLCQRCHGVMSERRPVYLCRDENGRIYGPFHAGCAERVVIQYRADKARELRAVESSPSTAMESREETLPW